MVLFCSSADGELIHQSDVSRWSRLIVLTLGNAGRAGENGGYAAFFRPECRTGSMSGYQTEKTSRSSLLEVNLKERIGHTLRRSPLCHFNYEWD